MGGPRGYETTRTLSTKKAHPTMPSRRVYQTTLEKLLETGNTSEPAIMHISNRIKTERGILKLLTAHYARSDVAAVPYAKGGTPLPGPLWDECVTDITVDNFCLYAVQPSYHFSANGTCSKTGALNGLIRGHTEDVLGFHVGNGLRANTKRKATNREEIAAYKARHPEERARWSAAGVTWLGQGFKLSMADVPVDDGLLARFQTLQARLRDDAIFIADIDLKVDLQACMKPRAEVELWLRTHQADHVQLEVDLSTRAEWDGQKLLLLDNTQLVGNNCHTFLRWDVDKDRVDTRQKAYGKFPQMMESVAVNKEAGCHVHDWCNQHGVQLAQAIQKCQAGGLTRLECTWYRRIPTMEEVKGTLKNLAGLVQPLAVHTPIATQWQTLSEHLRNTVVLVNAKTGHWELVRWFSHTTGKRNAVVGARAKYRNAHTLLQCLEACALAKLPIKVVYYGSGPDLTPVGLQAAANSEGGADADDEATEDSKRFPHVGRLYHAAVDVVLHGRTTTLFVRESSLYRRHATAAAAADFGLVATPNLEPALLRAPITRDSLCTPHLTWDGTEHIPPNAAQPEHSVTLLERLRANAAFKRSARPIQEALNSQVQLVDTARLPYRATHHMYGEAADGTLYRLPLGLAYPDGGCEVHVSAHGRVSLDGRILIDWTAGAKPLTALADGVYTVLEHHTMPATGTGRQKRKLCLAETEQLHLAQDDLDVEHATKFRKMGTFYNAQRKRRARIQMLHNNAAH